MTLIVFTHGLGASEGTWGSTIDVLRSHERVGCHEFKTWSYGTSKRPEPHFLRRLVQAARGRRYQSLAELGEELWSHLRSWTDSHDDVILVGHSLGGLITAAASVHGFSIADDRDDDLRAKLRGLVCIASPFSGSSSGKKLQPLYRAVGANQQYADLLPKSRMRKKIVHAFTRVLERRAFSLVLMRAAEDATVLSGEVTGPFSPDQYIVDVLTGGHADCISNLETEHGNIAKIVAAVEYLLSQPSSGAQNTEITLHTGRSVTIRREYDVRLSRMEECLDILAWGLASFREDYRNHLTEWEARGIQVRILLVNPDSPSGKLLCDLQDRLEGRAVESTANDVRTFLAEVKPLARLREVRVSDFHPGLNIFRIDGVIFFGPYLAGTVSRNAPTGIVSNDHWLYEKLLGHFECLWEYASVSSRSSDSY